MGNGGCVDGQLVTILYDSPVPLIGLYIAVATLVCFFCMTFDLVYGLFIRKKPLIPCKLFSTNAFTMMLLAIATKIPVDLTTPMPRAEDQLSKLTGTALLCTTLGYYMPSLGTMSTSERYSNMAALSVMVISMVVNVCIQMGTGVIFAFTIEHIIIMVCILVLLLLMWSSSIAFRGQKFYSSNIYKALMCTEKAKEAKGLQGMKSLLEKVHELNYIGNPQILLCRTWHHHTFGLLCTLSSTVVLQAMFRSFILKNMRLCSSGGGGGGGGVSDYRWSIPIIIVAQFLTIVVGTFSIIYRWLSFLSHMERENADTFLQPIQELEYLKLKTFLSSRFPITKKLSSVFLVAKNFIMDVLIWTQIVLTICSRSFIGLPIYVIKNFLKCIITFSLIIFCKYTNQDNERNTTITEADFRQNIIEGAILSLGFLKADPLNRWISIKAKSEMKRWKNKYERDTQPTHLIQLISKWPIFASNKSECGALFIRKLEAKGEGFLQGSTDTEFLREIFEIEYKYKVSCISILVLSRILEELMPSSRGESLMHSLKALDESFESICFVDQKITDTPNMLDEARWMSANDVWAQCENPNHWFQTKIISPAFKSFSLKKSESLQLHSALGCLEHAAQAVKKEFKQNFKKFTTFPFLPLAEKHMRLIAMEFVIICEFLQEQNYESVNHLFDFLEMCFVKMLCSTLSSLPLAIMKELEDGDDPTELSEGRVRKALKFLHVLELLEGRIEWSWPPKFDPKSRQANDVQAEPNQTTSNTTTTTTVVPDYCSSEVDGKIGNSDASLTFAAAASDANREIGSDEIV